MQQNINLEELEEHIKTIPLSEWDKLFQLIPKIEKSNSFGEMIVDDKTEDGTLIFPCMVPLKVVDDFYQIVHELGILPIFDWMNWEEGKDLLNSNETDYSKLNAIILCKLLTVIVRADRFNEGFIVSCFEKGIILEILKTLKLKIDC